MIKMDKRYMSGDIIKHTNYGIYKVIFQQGSFAFENRYYINFPDAECKNREYEVIGNIYENKELLNN